MDKRKRNEENSADYPLYSRLFVVCERQITEELLRNSFSEFGTVEDIKMPRDHNTGELKGIAFIKFSKASEAAAALQAQHGHILPDTHKPLKVMVAVNRSGIQTDDDDAEKYKRVFITVAKTVDESAIENDFGTFGEIESVQIQRHRDTMESKGFAYVKFYSFLGAALAVEGCDKKYRAIFADPRGSKRQETSFESNINNLAETSIRMTSMLSNMKTSNPRGYTRVMYMCDPYLGHMLVESLFDIVPGLLNCHFFVDYARNCGKGYATYSNPMSAAYAVEKLNEFEYPPGSPIFVKPDNSKFESQHDFRSVPKQVGNLRNAIAAQTSSGSPDLAKLAEAIAEASKFVKMATGSGAITSSLPNSEDLNYCSAALPEPKALAHIDSPVAMRCFLVCKPQPPSMSVLRDVFCRFGDLIDVYTLPNKTIGYARYASVEAAQNAIRTLHGAEVCGIRMKVLEAEEEGASKRTRHD